MVNHDSFVNNLEKMKKFELQHYRGGGRKYIAFLVLKTEGMLVNTPIHSHEHKELEIKKGKLTWA